MNAHILTTNRTGALALLSAIVLSGCGSLVHAVGGPAPAGTTSPTVLGATSATTTRSDGGDPPAERGGTIPATAAAAQNTVAGGAASTPRGAIDRFAALYFNWTASTLEAHQDEMAAMSTGAARLLSQQAAAQTRANSDLQAEKVSNVATLESVAPGSGDAAGQWVIVTDEQTNGSGNYAGLPPALHVTYATVASVTGGYAVSRWEPQN